MPKKKSPNSVRIRNSTAEFLTFAYQTGGDGVEVRVQDGTIWLSQKNIGLLFDTTPDNVLMHLRNIFAEHELPESATTKEFLVVQTEGIRQVQRSILHYHLDAIIAVGYRVNSKRATAFRHFTRRRGGAEMPNHPRASFPRFVTPRSPRLRVNPSTP